MTGMSIYLSYFDMIVKALTNNFIQFRTISYKKAVKALMLNKALACYEYMLFSFSEWQDVAVTFNQEDRYIRTITRKVYIPPEIVYPKAKTSKTLPKFPYIQVVTGTHRMCFGSCSFRINYFRWYVYFLRDCPYISVPLIIRYSYILPF